MLQKIPILSSLLEAERQFAEGEGAIVERDAENPKEISLFEWISSADSKGTMDQLYEHCSRGLEQVYVWAIGDEKNYRFLLSVRLEGVRVGEGRDRGDVEERRQSPDEGSERTRRETVRFGDVNERGQEVCAATGRPGAVVFEGEGSFSVIFVLLLVVFKQK